MQTQEVTQSALERRIEMSVVLADVEKDVSTRLARMARTAKMPGFRPGKLPMKMVEQQYGQQIRSEVMGEAVERAFTEKVREQNLRVAGAPRIEPAEGAGEGQMAFAAIFEVYPEIVIGDLAAREIERPVLEVGEAEVERTLNVLRKQRATYEAVDRASEKGDRVVIDFTGRKDGEIFDGGQATDFAVEVGGGQMLPEFDAQLAGAKAGDSKAFDLTFPQEYHAANLAGQTVQFEITVKTVEGAVLPPLDENLAKALGVADGDLDKFRAEIKANLSREVTRRIQGRVRDQVFEALDAVCAFQVPKALVEGESMRMAEAARQDMAQRGMDVSKMPVQPEWFAEQATKRVKLGLAMSEIVGKHELQAKPEQVRGHIEDMAQTYERPEEVVRWFYSKPENLRNIEDAVVENNVIAWALSLAKTSDKVVAFEDLMGTQAG